MSKVGHERPYHHGALRSAVLEAGRTLLAEQADDAFSLREVARKVGVSSAAVYRHFPDKASLLKSLAVEGIEELARVQGAAKEAAEDIRGGFLAMGEAYVTFALENPALFKLIYTYPPPRDPLDLRWGGVSAAMTLLLETSAEIAPSGVDVRAFALHSWALVHGLAMLVLDGQIPGEPASVRAALTAYPVARREVG